MKTRGVHRRRKFLPRHSLATILLSLLLLLVVDPAPLFVVASSGSVQRAPPLDLETMHLSVRCSQLSFIVYNYELSNQNVYEYYYYDGDDGTLSSVDGALMVEEEGKCIVAFRGTALTLVDWEQNLRGGTEEVFTREGDASCRARSGFVETLLGTSYSQELEDAIVACVERGNELVLTGHSQGASTAMIAAVRYASYNATVFAFATPATFIPPLTPKARDIFGDSFEYIDLDEARKYAKTGQNLFQNGDPCPVVPNESIHHFINTEDDTLFTLQYDPVGILDQILEALMDVAPAVFPFLLAASQPLDGISTKSSVDLWETLLKFPDAASFFGRPKGPYYFLPPLADADRPFLASYADNAQVPRFFDSGLAVITLFKVFLYLDSIDFGRDNNGIDSDPVVLLELAVRTLFDANYDYVDFQLAFFKRYSNAHWLPLYTVKLVNLLEYGESSSPSAEAFPIGGFGVGQMCNYHQECPTLCLFWACRG